MTMNDHSSTADPGAGGLRERKQRALRARVEQCAVDLVYERGYENVSVDEICQACEISQRTFFNHFGTKENAVVGDVFTQLDRERLQQVLDRSREAYEVVFELVASADRTFARSARLRQRRIAILRRDRDLFAAMTARMEAFRRDFIDLLAQRLAADRGTGADDAQVLADADLQFSLIVSLIKHVMHSQLHQHLGDEHDAEASIRRALHGARSRAALLLGEGSLPTAER